MSAKNFYATETPLINKNAKAKGIVYIQSCPESFKRFGPKEYKRFYDFREESRQKFLKEVAENLSLHGFIVYKSIDIKRKKLTDFEYRQNEIRFFDQKNQITAKEIKNLFEEWMVRRFNPIIEERFYGPFKNIIEGLEIWFKCGFDF